jgi:hypothetical protein
MELLERHYNSSMNECDLTTIDEKLTMEQISNHLYEIKEKIGDVSVDPAVITKIIQKLKIKKAPGYSRMENECYKYGPIEKIVECISVLFEIIINYQLNLSNINIGLLRPIIKNKKDRYDDINNIRPITLSDTIAIILECFVLTIMQSNMVINENQYGFRTNYSTQHAIFVLKETILQQQMDKKDLYICFLDYSKAFDKINKYMMILKLVGYISLHIISTLYNYMINAKIQIRNQNESSNIINIKRGVKQGGPASPFLFAWYINDMLTQIITKGDMAKIYGIDTGLICYADDTTAATDTRQKLQDTTTTIATYCHDHEIKLNECKTKWMKISKKYKKADRETIFINGKEIERIDSFKFLGFEITSNMKYYAHVTTRINKSRNVTFMLNKMGLNSKNLNSSIKAFMFKIYSRSVLTYGFENVYFTNQLLKEVKTYEGSIFKRILNLPKKCSTNKLLIAMDITPIDILIKLKKLCFIQRLAENNKTRAIIEEQCKRVELLHKQSLIREVKENILNNQNINTIEELLNKVKIEIDNINSKLVKTEEHENIRHLLSNRDKTFNEALLNILMFGG